MIKYKTHWLKRTNVNISTPSAPFSHPYSFCVVLSKLCRKFVRPLNNGKQSVAYNSPYICAYHSIDLCVQKAGGSSRIVLKKVSHYFHERKLNNDATKHHFEEVHLPVVGFGHNAHLDHVEYNRRIKERNGERDEHKFQSWAIFSRV